VRLSCTGLSRTDWSSVRVGGLDPRLRQAWVRKPKPRFGVQTRPLGGPAATLAAAPERPHPEPLHPLSHCAEFGRAEPQAKVLVEAVQSFGQIRLVFPDAFVAGDPQPFGGSCDEALARFDARCSPDMDLACARPRAEVGEAKEGEGRRLLDQTARSSQQAGVEVQQRCLLGRDAQPEGDESLIHFTAEACRLIVVVERRYVVIREARQFSVASAGLFEPPLEPQVEDVVQVDIRKHGACHASYNVAKRPDRENRG